MAGAAVADQSATFQIRPDLKDKFRSSLVREVIHSTLVEQLTGFVYSAEAGEEMTKSLSDLLRSKLLGDFLLFCCSLCCLLLLIHHLMNHLICQRCSAPGFFFFLLVWPSEFNQFVNMNIFEVMFLAKYGDNHFARYFVLFSTLREKLRNG